MLTKTEEYCESKVCCAKREDWKTEQRSKISGCEPDKEEKEQYCRFRKKCVHRLDGVTVRGKRCLCTHVTDSPCGTVGTKAPLQSNNSPIKIN